MIQIFLLFFSVMVSVASADSGAETRQVSTDAAMAVHSYGGGALLETVFKAIGTILYADADTGMGKTFNCLLKIALLVGGFSCICLAFFRQKFDPFLRNFILPGVVIIGFLLIPRTTIIIHDHSTNRIVKVDKVPFILGQFAEISSESIYRLQELIEKALKNEKKVFPWTQPLKQEDLLLNPQRGFCQNSVLEENLDEFCKECVTRDLDLGLYSRKNLSQASDLTKFLEEHTSTRREIFFKAQKEDQESSRWMTCRKAMELLSAGVKDRAEEIAKDSSLYIGTDALLGMKEEKKTEAAKHLIQQRIWIDSLQPGIKGKEELWQKSIFISLSTLHQFLEAFLYISFPLATLLALLSFGIRILLQWVRLVLWVKLWPIFFCVADCFLQSIWELRKSTLFKGLDVDLTIETAGKLSYLMDSMTTLSCIVVVCIPVLTWMFVRSGVSHIASFASSIFAPASPISKDLLPSHPVVMQPKTAFETGKQTYQEMVRIDEESQGNTKMTSIPQEQPRSSEQQIPSKQELKQKMYTPFTET